MCKTVNYSAKVSLIQSPETIAKPELSVCCVFPSGLNVLFMHVRSSAEELSILNSAIPSSQPVR